MTITEQDEKEAQAYSEQHYGNDGPVAIVAAECGYLASMMAERERCAKVVFDELYDGTLPSLRLTDRVCAAIRARRTT